MFINSTCTVSVRFEFIKEFDKIQSGHVCIVDSSLDRIEDYIIY